MAYYSQKPYQYGNYQQNVLYSSKGQYNPNIPRQQSGAPNTRKAPSQHSYGSRTSQSQRNRSQSPRQQRPRGQYNYRQSNPLQQKISLELVSYWPPQLQQQQQQQRRRKKKPKRRAQRQSSYNVRSDSSPQRMTQSPYQYVQPAYQPMAVQGPSDQNRRAAQYLQDYSYSASGQPLAWQTWEPGFQQAQQEQPQFYQQQKSPQSVSGTPKMQRAQSQQSASPQKSAAYNQAYDPQSVYQTPKMQQTQSQQWSSPQKSAASNQAYDQDELVYFDDDNSLFYLWMTGYKGPPTPPAPPPPPAGKQSRHTRYQ